jgi:CubicO group peptidase (beta-lactamase class C family)
MTKIITTVTALTLVEEGRLSFNDPISKYLPEFASPHVFTGGTADAPQLVPAESPITLREVLSQSSGLRYDVFGNDTLHDIYVRPHLWDSTSLQDFVTRAATLPLEHQPGARWTYGINTDILGAIIEKVSGEPLEQIERERIFTPLGMDDTSFSVPDAKLPRLAKLYQEGPDGKAHEVPPFGFITTQPKGTFRSGGGGLFSDAHDYARFAQMLLNGGEWNGKRILGRATVEMMSSIQIVPVPGPYSPPAFGFGVQVFPPDRSKFGSLGSTGCYGWDGYASTHVLIDPHEDMFVLLLTQIAPTDANQLFERFNNTVYQALP